MTLPHGWEATTLGEIGEILRGVTYDKTDSRSQYAKGLVPIARATNIQGGHLDRKELVYVPAFCVEDRQFLRDGDMVIATSSGSKSVVGKAARASAEHSDMAFGAFCGVLRPASPEIFDWTTRVFETPEYRDLVEAVAIGTNINNLRTRDLQGHKVSLPPAPEQRRIVAKLDLLTDRLARARAELDRVPVLAANLRSTALANTYNHLVDEFPAVTVRDLIAGLDQGWSPKCENFFSLDDDTWAVLKTTAIQALEFRAGENKVLPPDLKPRPRMQVEEGDVLVTRAGPRVRCGITCVVGKTRKRLMLADKMYRLRCKPDRAKPAYLALMLNAPQILAMIEAMKTGISDSGLNLTQDKFLSLPIPSASLEQQTLVEANLQTAFARADRLEAESARARALLDRLEAAILGKAFRGELVPQDPNEEPASVLLDRIRAQRAAAPNAKRTRRAKEGMEA